MLRVREVYSRCALSRVQEARFHKENVVRECLAVLAEAVQSHLDQYHRDRRVVNLIQLLIRAVDVCVPTIPDQAAR